MTEKKSSNLVNGISRGFYRIALVIGVAIVGIGGWISFYQKPEFTLTYRFVSLDPTPKLVNECTKGDVTFSNRWALRTTNDATVHLEFCFQRITVSTDDGQKYYGVAYNRAPRDMVYVLEEPSKYGSKEGDKYVARLMESFKPPEKDLIEVDKEYWSERLLVAGKALRNTFGILLGWILFSLLIRFIWRGFTNRDG